MKPAGKFKLWTGGFINKPSVSPPGTLRIVFLLCIISFVGTLWYSIVEILSVGGSSGASPASDAFLGFFHLVLPLAIAVSICTNHPSSRILILAYVTTLYVVTLTGDRLPRFVSATTTNDVIITTIAFLGVVVWLYRSRRMRYYYAIIQDHPVPQDLADQADDLSGNAWLSEKLRKRLNWLADNLELIIYAALIFGLVAAVSLIGNGW